MDNWDPEQEFEEIRKLKNPISNGVKEEILIFDLRKIDPIRDFENPELKAGLLLLKIIRDPWEDFIMGWNTIKGILNSMEESKKIDLEEEMLDYIFRSRLVVRQAHQPSLILIYIYISYNWRRLLWVSKKQ